MRFVSESLSVLIRLKMQAFRQLRIMIILIVGIPGTPLQTPVLISLNPSLFTAARLARFGEWFFCAAQWQC